MVSVVALMPVASKEKKIVPDEAESSVEAMMAIELVRQACEAGLDLMGPNGFLKQFTKAVLERALDVEVTGHLGRLKHEKSENGRALNTRNGTTEKTVLTDCVGEVEIHVPWDRDGSFEPVIVKKRQRRLGDVDEMVLLYAKGLTTGEISAHLNDIYGALVSKEMISRITDRVIEEMTQWSSRPLDSVCAAMFIDAIHVRVRDGQVANRAFYAAIGVDLDGKRDVLGIWGSPGGEGAKYWLSVLTEIKNRGVTDTFFLVCDGLKGLPDAVEIVWPAATIQTCILHLIRDTFRYASKHDWDALKRDVKPIYTAPFPAAAEEAREAMTERWGKKYPAIVNLWTGAWEQFIPFLDYDIEIRRVICSTNAIGSLNARFRRSVRARGHFPTEQAALKCLYLTVRSLDPTGRGQVQWITR